MVKSEEKFQAVLDFGADVSFIPFKFEGFGKKVPGGAYLRDAQGNEIPSGEKVSVTVKCETADGRLIGLRENFVMANVKVPLIAIGRWMKKGWTLAQEGGKIFW